MTITSIKPKLRKKAFLVPFCPVPIIYCKNKGVVFSFDALFAFIFALFIVSSFCIFLANSSSQSVFAVNSFYLQEKTFAVADSLVKNNSPDNYLFGSAIIDVQKKRVLSNNLASALIVQAKPIDLNGFFVKQITYHSGNSSKVFALSPTISDNCLSVKRFVLIDGFKAVLELTGCFNALTQ